MLRLFRHYVSTDQLIRITGDALVITLVLAVLSRAGLWLGDGSVWPKAVAVTAILVFTFYLADLYKPFVTPGPTLYMRLSLACAVAAVLAAALSFAFPLLRFGRLAFFEIFTLAPVGLLSWRAWHARRVSELQRERVLVLGATRDAASIVQLQSSGARTFSVIGFLDDAPDAHAFLPGSVELLGKSRDLLNLVDELRPDVVLVAFEDFRGRLPSGDLLACRLRGIRVEDWSTFYEKCAGKVLVTGLRPSWLIFSDGFVQNPYTQAIKRLVDLVAASSLLLLTLPILLATAIAIKVDSPGPILFRQARVGFRGRIFVLFKFRSMRVDAERVSGPVWAAADDDRVTRVGRFLRRSRIDELPQLFNVLLAHMSLVGPRPERPEFFHLLERTIPFYRERLSVKPGLTGWAQVRHAYAASVEDTQEKLEYDLYYIKNVSPFLDLLILLATVQVVLFVRGGR